MPDKTVAPSLGASSFTCPHCGAIAHQTWQYVMVRSYDKDGKPWIPDSDIFDRIQNAEGVEDKEELTRHFERIIARELFVEVLKDGKWSHNHLHNLYVSCCFSCERHSVWLADGLLYPSGPTEIEPNDEMPDEVRSDFLEAAQIVDMSPRGAAALLRLCIQKLVISLGLKGKNLDNDIGELVKRGLDKRIQKALDVVRVIGNNAVHPGQIDLKDDKKTSTELFKLVNIVVEAMIATPKHIDEMYGALPKSAIDAIDKRDGR